MELTKKKIVVFVSLVMKESGAKRIASMLPWWGEVWCLLRETVDNGNRLQYKIPDTTQFNI